MHLKGIHEIISHGPSHRVEQESAQFQVRSVQVFWHGNRPSQIVILSGLWVKIRATKLRKVCFLLLVEAVYLGWKLEGTRFMLVEFVAFYSCLFRWGKPTLSLSCWQRYWILVTINPQKCQIQ